MLHLLLFFIHVGGDIVGGDIVGGDIVGGDIVGGDIVGGDMLTLKIHTAKFFIPTSMLTTYLLLDTVSFVSTESSNFSLIVVIFLYVLHSVMSISQYEKRVIPYIYIVFLP